MRNLQTSSGYKFSGKRSSQGKSLMGPIVFLSVLSLLLALGVGLLLRKGFQHQEKLSQAREYEMQLEVERNQLLAGLDSLDMAYQQLAGENESLREETNRLRSEIEHLRARLLSEGSLEVLRSYRTRINELSISIERYEYRIARLSQDSARLSEEKQQISRSLSEVQEEKRQSAAREQMLADKLEQGARLRLDSFRVMAVREGRRGDRQVSRARQADRLDICFRIRENLLTEPGPVEFFFLISGPDSQPLIPVGGYFISDLPERIEASFREMIMVDGSDQTECLPFLWRAPFLRGEYQINVYARGELLISERFLLN